MSMSLAANLLLADSSGAQRVWWACNVAQLHQHDLVCLGLAVDPASGPDVNPTIPNPAWNSLEAITGFGPWGVTRNCKVKTLMQF
jgi:hypothetical protein